MMKIGHIELFSDGDELMIREHGGSAQTIDDYVAFEVTPQMIEDFQKQCQEIIDAMMPLFEIVDGE